MVLFAMITRVMDGLPLSASTDLDLHFELKETKKQSKALARKANQFPIRCSMKNGNHVIHFVKAVGVCFMTICESSYPTVLAFSFLDEIQREFTMNFQSQDVQRVRRPYSFIEFDTFIQKTKGRYNSPRNLTSRLNLNQLSEYLHNDPPYEISTTELGNELETDNGKVKTFKTGGPPRQLVPLSWVGGTACMLSAICVLLNFLRFVPLLNFINVDDESESTLLSAFVFFLAGLLNFLLCYLLLFPVKWRLLLARFTVASLIGIVYFLSGLRNSWQILFHCVVAVFALYVITKRQLKEKPPDYNV